MKRISRILLFWTAAVLGCLGCRPGDGMMPSESFGAYYTHLETDAPFEQYSRTGEYADIIVDLGPENGKLVFWRGSSYLPYWEPANRKKQYLRELVKRSGDGSGRMTDRINLFSYVKVLSEDKDSVCILWRYNPSFNGGNPRTGVESQRAVEEYFTVRPDGRVSRMVMSGKDIYTQELLLTRAGIKTISRSQETQSVDTSAVTGPAAVAGLQEEPVLWFKFDEGKGDMTREAVSGKSVPVNGVKAYWRRGVSGTALQFDDVSSSVEFDAELSRYVKDEISLEAWVSLGAYPWNWCPLVQQASDSGFYLGINGDGRAGLRLKTGGTWEEMVAEAQLERWKWYHIVGTYSSKDGKMCIYTNGKLVAEKQVPAPGPVELSDAPVKLGRGEDMRPINPVRESTYPAGYSLDGLLDEVRIYARAFTPGQVESSYRAYNPDGRADMPARILPGKSGDGGFGARYSCLPYHDAWDNLFRFGRGSDVTVSFDGSPARFVFWRGVSYIPMMVNGENQWYSNEFNETWGTSGGNGCQEPMSDKASDISHVRIIENTPARVVVHWRYALPDVNYVLANYDASTGWCDMADWYYYIYPDGVAACRKRLWTSGERNHEWQESMVIFGPDQHPHDILERHSALRMIGEDGTVGEYDWIQAPPENISYPQNANIQQLNFRSDYDPFIIGTSFEGSNVYNGELTPYAVFCTWNHWPIAQIPSDGRYATFPDRAAHSSLSHIFLPVFREGYGDRPFVEKLSLEGMWNSPAEELGSLSRSWTHAPELAGVSGADWEYLQEQRAYLLNVKDFPVSFTVNASAENPACNLCFLLKGWNDRQDAVVDIPGVKVSQGTVRDTDGSFTKIIFVHYRGASPLEVTIDKEQFSRHFTIVPDDAVSDTLSLAVNDLQSYIQKAVPGAGVQIGGAAEKGNIIHIVRNPELGWNSYRISSEKRGKGCYAYTLEGADIWGLQYAVYDLAERLLGVKYLKPDLDYITVQEHFRPVEINSGVQSPDYKWRGLYPWHYNYNSRGLNTFCDINRHFADGDWNWYKRLCDWMIKNRQNAVLWFDDVFSHENISGQFPAHVQDYFALRGIRQILGMGWASNEDLQSKDKPMDRPYCLNAEGKSVEDAAWKRNICPMSKEYFPLADINFSRMDLSRPGNYLGCLIGYGENGWAAKEKGTDCVLHKGVPSSSLMMRDYGYVRSKLDKAGLADIPLGFVTSTWSIHPGNPFETDAFLDALPEGSIFTMHTYQQTDWQQFRRLYEKIAQKNKGFKVFHIAEVAFLCGTDIPLFRPGILERREGHFKTLPRENTIGHLATLNTMQYLYWLSTWQEMRWQWNSEDTCYDEFYPEILQKLLFLENGSSSPWRRYSRDSHPAGFGFLLWAGEIDREKLQEAEACLDSVLELDRQLVKAGDRLYIKEFSPSVRLTANYYGIRIYCGLRDYDMAIECLEEYNRIFTEEMGMTPDSDFVENPDISYLENLKTKIQ